MPHRLRLLVWDIDMGFNKWFFFLLFGLEGGSGDHVEFVLRISQYSRKSIKLNFYLYPIGSRD